MLEEVMSMLLCYFEALNGDDELSILDTHEHPARLDEDC